MVEIMVKSSSFFLLLINDILDFLRFESGGLVLDLIFFNFIVLMGEVENIVCFLVFQKNIFFIMFWMLDFFGDVFGDSNWLF